MRPAPASRAQELQASNPGRARSGGQLAQGLGTWCSRPPWQWPPGPQLFGPAPCPAAPSSLSRQGRQDRADLPVKLRTAWEKPAPRFSCLRLMLSVAERADSAGELEGLGPSRRLQEPGWPGVLGKSKRSHRLCAPLTWPKASHRGKSWVPKSWLPPSAGVGALDWELFQRGGAVSLHVPWRGWGWARDSESPRPPTPRRFQKHALPRVSGPPRLPRPCPLEASPRAGSGWTCLRTWFALRVPALVPALSTALCEV